MAYLSTEQAAERLKISSRRIRALCKAQKFPGAILIGKYWAIPEESLSAVTIYHKVGRPPQKKAA